MEQKFIELFKEVLETEDLDIQLNDKFREYDDWDSLVYLSLIAMLDEEFGVAIENNDFQQLHTVEDIIDEIKKRANS